MLEALTPEASTNIGYVLGYIIVGIISVTVAYFVKKPVTPPKQTFDPVLAGVGMGLAGKSELDRIIIAFEGACVDIKRIAVASEAILDKRQNDMAETLDEIAESIKKNRGN